MKIAVIGAGIIGVTTAYELACDGHEVTVLERRGAAAEEASFANAGLLTSGHITTWSDPSLPAKMLRHCLSRGGAIKARLPLSGRDMAWMWKWYHACKLETFSANLAPLQRLAHYSRERLHDLTASQKLEYERSDGQMILLRTEQDSSAMQLRLRILSDAGVAFKELNPIAARKIEYGLNPDTALFGAIHLPNDEAGNCRQFALMLKNDSLRRGVKFSFNTAVTHVASSTGIELGIAGEKTPRQYDAAVLCAGLDSIRLLQPLSLKVPMTAVHGYSVSATIREPLNAPRSAVMDEHYKVTVSRLGNRVRVAGSTEIGGLPEKKYSGSFQTLYKVLHDWYPGAVNLSNGVQEWKGACPTLPDGLPILGASGISKLWLNLGHGGNGWTLSCGSAKVLSDLINNKKPDFDTTGLEIARLHL